MCRSISWSCANCTGKQVHQATCNLASMSGIPCVVLNGNSISPVLILHCQQCGAHFRKLLRHTMSHPAPMLPLMKVEQDEEHDQATHPASPPHNFEPPLPTSATLDSNGKKDMPSDSPPNIIPPREDPFWIAPQLRLPNNEAVLAKYDQARNQILGGGEPKGAMDQGDEERDAATFAKTGPIAAAWDALLQRLRSGGQIL